MPLLPSAKYWTFRVPDKRDCVLPLGYTEDDVEGCNIYISVCKPLGNTTCRGYPNSTTCQQVVMSNLDPFYYDMGTYTDNFEFSPLGKDTGGLLPLPPYQQIVRLLLAPKITEYTANASVCPVEWSSCLSLPQPHPTPPHLSQC